MRSKGRLLFLMLLASLLVGCTAHYAKYNRMHTNKIDEYYSTAPARPYRELRRLSVTFNEIGVFTGKGSDDVIIEMLKDKAAEIGADGIVGIRITTERIPLERNLQWIGRAMAIQYLGRK